MRYKLALAVMALSASMPANATIITRHFDVVARGFAVEAPLKRVAIRFSVSIDSLTSIVARTQNGLTIHHSNLVDYPAPFFTYFDGSFPDVLTIGTNPGYNSFIVSPGFKTFGLKIVNFGSQPVLSEFRYTGWPPALQTFEATDITLRELASVPEPGMWMMMAVGFGLVGLSVRRRRAGIVAA